jgi:hypothetical protein
LNTREKATCKNNFGVYHHLEDGCKNLPSTLIKPSSVIKISLVTLSLAHYQITGKILNTEMITFWNWLLKERSSTYGKFSLYPDLYTQCYNYPPCDSILWSADAITYMDKEDLNFKFLYGKKFVPHTWKTINNSGGQVR